MTRAAFINTGNGNFLLQIIRRTISIQMLYLQIQEVVQFIRPTMMRVVLCSMEILFWLPPMVTESSLEMGQEAQHLLPPRLFRSAEPVYKKEYCRWKDLLKMETLHLIFHWELLFVDPWTIYQSGWRCCEQFRRGAIKWVCFRRNYRVLLKQKLNDQSSGGNTFNGQLCSHEQRFRIFFAWK